jgi:hypothetical protein
MGTGAMGYLLGSHAGQELLPALEAMSLGKRFISAVLTGHPEDAATRGTPPLVAACGEGTGHLLRTGRTDAVVRLEHLWSALASAYNVDMLCGFPMDVFGSGEYRDAMDRIRAQHTAANAG